MPTDRETGQPRGFAFVTMGSTQAANAAISQLGVKGTLLQ
jgi:RNA recognition motif-containing protein